ncbi:unnamed protein product [Strongylus vulgaris]|uniref:EGF-like domain-containing protein n=1 Tax=Strongylus vulgaris TaxID=40348 RepID=A0A3P7J771_STRVU|nr:unnamed protein product [Strongylus vulgaris]
MVAVSGTSCYLSTTSLLNVSSSDEKCNKKCDGDGSEQCAGGRYARVFIYEQVEIDPNACDDHKLCSADLSQGICVDMAADQGNYLCKCDPMFTGTNCETPVSGPCNVNPCKNGGVCIPDTVLNTYTCQCAEGYCGKTCQYAFQCSSNPCLHGGTCVENYDGTRRCECLDFYSGTNCEDVNTCAYNNKCVNGTCDSIVNGVVPGSICTCNPGYTGEYCQESEYSRK